MPRDEDTDTILLVLTTVPDEVSATRITAAIIGEKLAACVNRIPGLLSTYVWQEKLRHDDELLLLIKTTGQRWPALRERIVALHPYELPEVIAVTVSDAQAAYRNWIQSCCA